ncbi:carbamate kinase [Streptomyces sp. NPDC097704]|uniref:amino acid kinase family protein n=1 Tax=Streptomyces sp. NPDC097704 TaxID=3157101 RepID=UPI0033280502
MAEDPHVQEHDGVGPQVGLLALQNLAYQDVAAYPLDILGAETQGMMGYVIQQELSNALAGEREVAAVLTMTEVDEADPAFERPTKLIGPAYSAQDAAEAAAEYRWTIARDGGAFRRVVPSPEPLRIMQAVVDKDAASAALAADLEADMLIMLTDGDFVSQDRGTPEQRDILTASPEGLAELAFAEGSMKPKVDAAIRVARAGGRTLIGPLERLDDLMARRVGTEIRADVPGGVVYVGE